MIAPAPYSRLGTVTVLVLAMLGSAGVSRADVPAGVTAVVGPVTCAGGDGSVQVTLTAGAAATDFELYVDGELYGDDDVITVPASTSVTITVTGLDDDGHTFDVVLPADPDLEIDAEDVVSTTRDVACDAAPVGPYTNPKGSVDVFCGNEAVVSATNKPIGGNTADLQPVEFTLSYQPWNADDSEGDDVGLPLDVAPTVIDTVTLSSGTPTYERVLAESELDELSETSGYGMLNLTIGGVAGDVVAQAFVVGTCVVLADGPEGVALPSTGA